MKILAKLLLIITLLPSVLFAADEQNALKEHTVGYLSIYPAAGTSTFSLNAAANWPAYAYVPSITKTIKKIRIDISALAGSTIAGDASLELQGDTNGAPNGTAVETKTATPATGFLEFATFSTSLTAGIRYWFVLKNVNVADPTANYFTVRYPSNSNGGVRSFFGANGGRIGYKWARAVKTTTNSGGAWTNASMGANYRLEFTDGTFAGNPVDTVALSSAAEGIYGTRKLGVLFTIPAGYPTFNTACITMPVTTTGTPGTLHYSIYTGATPSLLDDTNVLPLANNDNEEWEPLCFSTIRPLTPGTIVRVVAATDGTGSNVNYWRLYKYTIENDANSKALTPFGGLQMTYFDGSTWTDTSTSFFAFGLNLDVNGPYTVPAGTSVAQAVIFKLDVEPGTASYITQLREQDNAGLPVVGLTSASLTCYQKRNKAAAGTVTLNGTCTVGSGTYVSGCFKEVTSPVAYGAYEFHIPNAVLAAGAENAQIVCTSATAVPTIFDITLKQPTSLSGTQAFNNTGNTIGGITGNITGSLSGSVGSVGSVTALGPNAITAASIQDGALTDAKFASTGTFGSGSTSTSWKLGTGISLSTPIDGQQICHVPTGQCRRCNTYNTGTTTCAVDTGVIPINGEGYTLGGKLDTVATLSGNQTFNMIGNITGNLSGTVGSVLGAVASIGAGGITAASFGVDVIGHIGTAQSVTSNTIRLAASETYGDDDLRINNAVMIMSSTTGKWQVRCICNNASSNDLVTLCKPWKTTPTGPVKYAIIDAPNCNGAIGAP